MAGNPRKFSEKIALHNQKQAEETNAFDQIMQEVSKVKPATPSSGAQPIKQQHLSISNYRHQHGGSLPNVNQMPHHHHHQITEPRPYPQHQKARSSIGPVRSKSARPSDQPYPSITSSATSNFYSNLHYNTMHLSPPDPNWRRTNSDSALNSLIPSTVPDSSEESSSESRDPKDTGFILGMSVAGGDLNQLGLPQQVVTGSLPDLTSFPFGQNAGAKEDGDEKSNYSASPVTNSSYSPHNSPNSNSQQMDPLHVHIPFQHQPNYNDPNMLSAYRDPQRPSPQNSPSPNYRSASPLLENLSPGPSSPQQHQQMGQGSSDFYQFQRQIEQLSVGDSNKRHYQNAGHWHQGVTSNDQFFYPPSNPLTGATAGISNQSPGHCGPNTPQTPTSIPEINISEFFTTPSNSASVNQYEFDQRSTEQLEELLATEAGVRAIRETLGPIDLLDFQLLDNQIDSLVDPNVEDEFRINR